MDVDQSTTSARSSAARLKGRSVPVAAITRQTSGIGRQKHPATADDESWSFGFPDATDTELATALTDHPLLARGGWRVIDCSFPTLPDGREDRRIIHVELVGPGGRTRRAWPLAINYLDCDVEPLLGPERRYPEVVARLTTAVIDATDGRTAS